jgi:hypothetical protein
MFTEMETETARTSQLLISQAGMSSSIQYDELQCAHS